MNEPKSRVGQEDGAELILTGDAARRGGVLRPFLGSAQAFVRGGRVRERQRQRERVVESGGGRDRETERVGVGERPDEERERFRA